VSSGTEESSKLHWRDLLAYSPTQKAIDVPKKRRHDFMKISNLNGRENQIATGSFNTLEQL
jgi:hypothetical protein